MSQDLGAKIQQRIQAKLQKKQEKKEKKELKKKMKANQKQARQNKHQEARGETYNPLRPPLSSFASRSINPFAPPPRPPPASSSQPQNQYHNHQANESLSSGELLSKTINDFIAGTMNNINNKNKGEKVNVHKVLQQGIRKYTALVTQEALKNVNVGGNSAPRANPPPNNPPPNVPPAANVPTNSPRPAPTTVFAEPAYDSDEDSEDTDARRDIPLSSTRRAQASDQEDEDSSEDGERYTEPRTMHDEGRTERELDLLGEFDEEDLACIDEFPLEEL